MRHFLLVALLLFPAAALGQAAPQLQAPVPGTPGILSGVGIDQKLGAQVPMDDTFTDEFGKPVKVGDLLHDRPAILVLNYFDCPQLCGLVLNDLSRTLKVMPTEVGKDFDVIAVSFDPRDTHQIAHAKRDAYAAEYERATGRRGTRGGWHFLVGQEPQIRRLTDAVGFRYQWDEKHQQYAHAAGVMVLTPEGKVARYFYGIDYRSNDLRLAVSEAAGEKLSSPVEQIVLYCFAYDPSTGRYSLAIWRGVKAASALTFVGLVGLVGTLVVRDKRKARRAKMAPTEQGVEL